jgi:SWIM zinc finger
MTEYFFKRTEKGALIFKDDFDHPIYEIKDKSCSCPGAMYHKVRCKHLAWYEQALHDTPWQVDMIYEFDRFSQRLIPWEGNSND